MATSDKKVMRIKIRIYNPYDLDIIALSETKGFSVPTAMKQTLKYYAAGKRYLVEIPTLVDEINSGQYSKGFYVELDEEADAQAIAFIKSIPDGLRNAFMKNIFRASFEVCPLSLYMTEGGSDYVAKMIANPRYGKYPVQREIVDPVYLAENEVGVTISDSMPDISKLPHGNVKGESFKPKTAKDNLRDLTRSAYNKAAKKREEENEMAKKYVEENTTVENNDDDDLDDLLSQMME